jgi:tape measure domain-containing protein
MAELEFNVKANFDEIAKARQELERFRNELSKVTKSTDPIVVQDLTDKYNEQSRKVKELTSAMSRYATVTSDDFSKKMQSLTREVYSFELQADAFKRKIEKLSTEIGKMQAKLRQGNLDSGSASILTRDIGESSTVLADEQKRYENLTGLGKQAKLELQNMQAEYAKYSGSSNAASDSVRMMTDALANMVSEMKQVPTVGEGASSLLSRLRGDALGLATSLVGGLGFEQLAQHIFNVRSEFQQLEISFTTMLGSEQKSGALMSQLIDTAAKTPFDMSSITNGAKQLLAYGTAANEVNDILVHLGDISAGLNVPLGDLVYLYGTTMAQGRMYTMDLRQFMGRGIPMAEELGKLMGKTTQEVQEAVSKGQVGADLVKKAIEGMTAEGGKFGGLMEKQSATLQGKWSNIGDSVDQMFNELGKKSEGIFGTGLDLISSLVDNWETVVKVIGTAAVAVGTYKAGLMAAASIQKVQNQATLDSISGNLDSKIQSYREQAELYHSYNGKDTSDYKASRMADLTTTVSNTDMIGNEKAEQLVSLKIKEAQTDGIITEQMAEQLQLKRDMLVAQQQSAAKEQMEADALTKGLDAKMSQYKEMENDYRHLNGKDTKDYKASRYNELGDVLSDTENIGDEETEQRVSKQIELAKSEGLISEEMAKQLQLKRDLLVEQTKLAEKEQLQYENTINAKQAAEEELRIKQQQEQELAQAKAESELRGKIAKANETAYGKALLETNALQKKVDLQQESYDKAMDEAREKRTVLAQLDEEIQKQKQLIEQKEADIVNDGGSVDTTNYGGYEDAFSDNENTAIADYEAEQAKLEELIQKRQQANEEFESANEKRKAIQQELQESTEKLTEAQEKDLEVYMEAGGEADEIGELVQQGIDIEEGKITVTEAATAATQANTTSETANSTAKQANTTATGTNTTANAANTTSEAANTGATNTNTTSENVNTGAKERNSLVTSILSVGTKGLSLAQNVLTYATNAVTTSLKGMWAAMLANPLTSVITLVTTAISVFSMFGSEEEDASAKTQDMGNKAAEASNKVRSLFAILSSGKAEDHKDTINELKSAYEEYGVKLDETKMKSKDMGEQLDELKSHENELIGLIEKRSIEMERANQLQEAYNGYNTANDTTFSTFKDNVGDDLSDVEKGTIRSLVSQDDIDKLAQLKQQMSECGDELGVYNALEAQYKQAQTEINAKLVTYLTNMGHSRSEIASMMGDLNDLTNGLADNKAELDNGIDAVNNSADAAENARKSVSGLTNAQEVQALKNQFAKKTFKELNSDIQETIKMCSKKIGLDIKVNYDDSQLPAWIKNMSQSQLKASMAARKSWLDTHKKGDVLQIGGQYKTYEQVANELAMMQARGTNVENTPKKSQKELDKEKKAKEKAAKAAEKARNEAETQAGNRKKAEKDYTNAVSSYSEKAEETISNNRIAAMQEGYEKELEQIKANDEKQKKAIEDGIDKLVEARKKRDQTVWVNSGKNRKANMWKQSKSDDEYRKEVMGEQMKDDKGNAIKDENGNTMTIADSYKKQMDAVDEKTKKSTEEVTKKAKESEQGSIWSYLKEYGDSKEKRTALQEEADDKKKKLDENKSITETDREYQKKSIDAGLKKSLEDLDVQDLKKSINWDFVFGDLENVSKDTLGAVKDQLQAFIDSAKDLKPDEIKTLVDAMSQIQEKMDLTTPIQSIKSARTEYASLKKTYAAYKKEYDDATASGDTTKQKEAAEKMITTEQKMVKARSKEKASYQNVISTAQNYVKALEEVGDAIGGTTGECIKLAASGISAGLGMAQGVKAFQTATSNLERSVAILAIIEAALQAVQAITQLFGSKEDTTLTDYVDTLDTYINLLDDSISELNEDMSDTQNTMKDTIAYYEQLVSLEKDSATAIKSQSQTWLNSGASGGSHSEGIKIRNQIKNDLKSSNAEVKKFYQEGYNSLNEYYKKVNGTYANSVNDFGRMDFIWKLSDDDLKKLAEDTKALSLLGDTLSSAVTNYVSKLEQIEDDEDSLAESLLNVSFDDFYDDFTSLIKDMDNTSADFANNFAEYMRNALVKNLVASEYKDKLEKLYKKAVEYSKEGTLEAHINELREEYKQYANSAKAEVETIDDITGYDSSYSQSASSGTFETMSQDTGEELNGRFTAVQIATEGTRIAAESINTKLDQVIGLDNTESDSFLTANISLLTANVGNMWVAMDEGRTILAQSLMCLQSIDERQDGWNKPILQLCTDVSRMREKVDRL